MAGGVGIAATDIPFVSNGIYKNWPTSMSVSDLVFDGNQAAQDQALFGLLLDAAAIADTYTMGASMSGKGASLRATEITEMALVPVINGHLKLICDYKNVLEVRGVDVGIDPSSLSTIGPNLAQGIRLGRRTIYVPYAAPFVPASPGRLIQSLVPPGQMVAAWSYLNGFPHTKLTASTPTTGSYNSITVQPTDGVSGLLGIYPGTVMWILDVVSPEAFTVQSVSGNVITATANFKYAHQVPTAPDFMPVTAVPDNVRLANIYLVTALLKTRGDSSLFLEEVSEPRSRRRTVGDLPKDFEMACRLLEPYKVRLKSER